MNTEPLLSVELVFHLRWRSTFLLNLNPNTTEYDVRIISMNNVWKPRYSKKTGISPLIKIVVLIAHDAYANKTLQGVYKKILVMNDQFSR
jgi:hypothetical protein